MYLDCSECGQGNCNGDTCDDYLEECYDEHLSGEDPDAHEEEKDMK